VPLSYVRYGAGPLAFSDLCRLSDQWCADRARPADGWASLPGRAVYDKSPNDLASSARRLVIEATYVL